MNDHNRNSVDDSNHVHIYQHEEEEEEENEENHDNDYDDYDDCDCWDLYIYVGGAVSLDDKEKVKYVKVADFVTEIADHAFDGCHLLTTIHISPSVERIGLDAFYGCSSLKYIRFVGYKNYNNSTTMTTTSTPPSPSPTSRSKSRRRLHHHRSHDEPSSKLQEIGAGAFSGCTSLQKLELPDSVEVIEDYSFIRCSGLKYIRLPLSLPLSLLQRDTGISNDRNSNHQRNNLLLHRPSEISLRPSSENDYCLFQTIKSSVFQSCTSLITISLPYSTTRIGDYAFDGCSGLETIYIPSTLTSIGKFSFLNCSSLKYVIAFNVAMSSNQENDNNDISNSNNNSNNNSMRLDFNGNVSNYKQSGNDNDDETANGGLWTFPNLNEIGSHAFQGCTSLRTIDLSDSLPLQRIGQFAFRGCTTLQTVRLPPNYSVTTATIAATTPTDNVATTDVVSSSTSNHQYQCQCESGDGRNETSNGRCHGRCACFCPSCYTPLTKLSAGMFSGCSELATIYIPTTIRKIGAFCFQNCFNLSSIIVVDDINTHIQKKTNENNNNNTKNRKDRKRDDNESSSSLFPVIQPSVQLPKNLEEIGNHSFDTCTSLLRIDIPTRKIQRVGKYAFFGCLNLIVLDADVENEHGNEHVDTPYHHVNAANQDSTCEKLSKNKKHNHRLTTDTLQFVCDLNRGGRRFLQKESVDQQPSQQQRQRQQKTTTLTAKQHRQEPQQQRPQLSFESHQRKEKKYPISLWPLILNRVLHEMPLPKSRFRLPARHDDTNKAERRERYEQHQQEQEQGRVGNGTENRHDHHDDNENDDDNENKGKECCADTDNLRRRASVIYYLLVYGAVCESRQHYPSRNSQRDNGTDVTARTVTTTTMIAESDVAVAITTRTDKDINGTNPTTNYPSSATVAATITNSSAVAPVIWNDSASSLTTEDMVKKSETKPPATTTTTMDIGSSTGISTMMMMTMMDSSSTGSRKRKLQDSNENDNDNDNTTDGNESFFGNESLMNGDDSMTSANRYIGHSSSRQRI